MTQPIIFALMLLALVLPVLGAIVLRLLGPRLTLAQLYVGAALLFVIAVGSVLALARGEIPSLQIGNLSILLPLTAPDDIALAPTTDSQSPADVMPPPETLPATAVLAATAQPTLATTAVLSITAQPALTATTTLTATATALPTTAAITATATLTPTATALPATPTPIPPTPVPPTAVPAPAAQRKYTVKAGDTLLSIARQFNTTVQAIIDANKLTPQQADSLRVGQELIIP